MTEQYRQCIDCLQYLSDDFFYTRSNGKVYTTKCKECYRKEKREKYVKDIQEKFGGNRVKVRPNKYVNEYQRESTFEIMILLGYTFDEETGIWFKEGWKEIQQGKPIFLNIKKAKRRGNTKITDDLIEQIIKLKTSNNTYRQVAEMLKLSTPTVYKYFNLNGKLN